MRRRLKNSRLHCASTPSFAGAHKALAVVREEQGQIDEAISEYQAVLRISPDQAEAHYNLGVAYTRKGRIEEAISEYQAALRINPDAPHIHIGLALAYSQQGRTEEAIGEYQAALRVQPRQCRSAQQPGLDLQAHKAVSTRRSVSTRLRCRSTPIF